MKRNLLISLLILLLVAACSGGPAATPLPTPSQIPTYNYVQPTLVSVIVAVDATETPEAVAAVDPEMISQGHDRYVALKCSDCHGENGEGNGDKGPTLVGLSLSEDDFITFMRSGGKLGTAHQFAANRL